MDRVRSDLAHGLYDRVVALRVWNRSGLVLTGDCLESC
jgi:hypothetical protein